MTDEGIIKQLAEVDKLIGEAKAALLNWERIAVDAGQKVSEWQLELRKLRTQRDEILTPDMFA